MSETEPFRLKQDALIIKEELHLSEVYNDNETGLYWRPVQRKIYAFKNKEKPGRKKRFYVLFCTSTAGTHGLNTTGNLNVKVQSTIFC